MTRNSRSQATPVILALLLCTALTPATSEAGRRAIGFVDAPTYLQHDADAVDAWYLLRYQLGRNFDHICGDTFCEGEYSNIQSLRFACSVERVGGAIGGCGWSFAAGEIELDPRHGILTADTPSWLCPSPLQPGTTIEALLESLAGDEPLYAALPGTSQTLYDGLVDCL